jgi:hypothetical protein
MTPINYDKFFRFWLENKNKIFMKSGEKHINQHNVSKWLDNIQLYSPEEIKETYLFFANTFIEFLIYVSFEQFYDVINNMSLELNTILTRKLYDKIYFYIPEEINKSNLWVSLLFFDCLVKNKILSEDQKNKISFVNSYNDLIGDSNDQQSLCLYCDDMSYTGNQINSNFNLRIKSPSTHIDKYIVITHISNIAKEKLLKLTNCYFFDSTIHVFSYVSQLKLKYYDTNKLLVNNVLKMFEPRQLDPIFKLGKKACDCNEKYIALYFDHKIADELSTFNKILFTGSYPIYPETTCAIHPLINGCNIEDLTSIFENPCIKNTNYDIDIPCFPSFYKTIIYTINGKPVSNTNNIDIVLDIITDSSIHSSMDSSIHSSIHSSIYSSMDSSIHSSTEDKHTKTRRKPITKKNKIRTIKIPKKKTRINPKTNKKTNNK